MRSRRRKKTLALLGAALALAVAAGPLAGGASSQTGDGGAQSKNPLAGDGMWIWYLSRSSHGKLGAIAKKARAHGIETVLIKSGDGTGYWSQFSPRVVSGLHARGLRVCAWQFIYGRKPGKEARVGAAAVANGADCLVLDVEGQYEGKYPQASYFMSSLRSRIGADYPVGLASFPYVDYHPALPFSVFLGPGGAQYNLPQLYWKDIGTTVDTGYTHTWVWNRIYQRPILPLGQVYNNPKAGQVRRFRALAMSHGFDGVSWWSWQSARKRQWKAVGAPVAPASATPYPSYPFLRLGSKGDFVAWAQQLLAGGGYTVRINGYYQSPTQIAVYAFQADRGLPQTGNLDVPTWSVLIQNKPLPVRWTKGGAVAAGSGDRLALPTPKSAKLPAVRDEIPPPSERAGR
ncbi:MAG TPA: peptidoglycan-binding domain-containing protein [Solirubrobacterales bacterium]|nr:peptidoglycan-binding domain-containing protein [Solirubrobacterales bacterium]